MLMVSNVADERLTTTHRAKLAYIYVRQSSVHQVRQHQESTELQYRLVDRAVRLGWPHERVQVIDEDLGKSGAGGVERQGFQKLIAEIGLGNGGLVISLDASRLARNNRDWHQLLELCSVFGVLIADGERLYDPRAYHDRLLLGLAPHKQHPAVAEPDMGGLHDHGHAIEQDDLMAPVELIGFSQRKAQRDVGRSRGFPALLAPPSGVTAHGIVTAVIAAPAELLEDPDQCQLLPSGFGRVPCQQSVEFCCPSSQLRPRLDNTLVLE